MSCTWNNVSKNTFYPHSLKEKKMPSFLNKGGGILSLWVRLKYTLVIRARRKRTPILTPWSTQPSLCVVVVTVKISSDMRLVPP